MWSESVYLDAVSADGGTAVVTRLARHTDEGRAWLWLHAFGEVEIAFVADDLPCDERRTVDDGRAAVYSLVADGVSASFERRGPKDAPDDAVVRVRVPGVELDATFTAEGASGSNLPGRSEALGRVDATLRTAGATVHLSARGQLHEQHQDTPRFTVPFTYGTLRGDGLGTVFLVGPERSGGFVRRGSDVERATAATIDAVGPERRLRLDLQAGGVLTVDVTTTHRYGLPINGRKRDSSIVRAVAGGTTLSGCINDWAV